MTTQCHECHRQDELRNLEQVELKTGNVVYVHERCIKRHNVEAKKALHMLRVISIASFVLDHGISTEDPWAVERLLREKYPALRKQGGGGPDYPPLTKRFIDEVVEECREQVDDRDGPHDNRDRAEREIREELKAAFPQVDFRIEKNGHLLSIEWTDGPPGDAVQAIVGKYELRMPAVGSRNEQVLIIPERMQVCPECDALGHCHEPTEPTKIACYVCGANGGLDEPNAA